MDARLRLRQFRQVLSIAAGVHVVVIDGVFAAARLFAGRRRPTLAGKHTNASRPDKVSGRRAFTAAVSSATNRLCALNSESVRRAIGGNDN